jgi:hypothetical protein
LEADGASTTVYYPKPTTGKEVLRPGNHPSFQGIRSDNFVDKLNFLSLMLALFCGTASLPHILIRYYTVADQAAARKSTIVGIGSIGFFYILTLYMGLGAMTSGALDVTNSNMAAPLLARSFSQWLFAVISAIAFTTVLGTVSGLIIASSGAPALGILLAFPLAAMGGYVRPTMAAGLFLVSVYALWRNFASARGEGRSRANRSTGGRDGVDAALSPTASQCAKLVMLKS